MACTTNFNGVFEALPDISRLHRAGDTRKRASIVGCLGKKQEQIQEHPLKTTRRLALGIASISLFANSAIAEDNGYWITSPTLPTPPVYNKINNEETGTRSFLKKGIYIADIGAKNRAFRIYKYAFDLLAMGDLIQQEDVWDYIRRYLRLKSTFMYYDFDKVISAAPPNDKPPLLDLANRLFDNFEKLDDAVKREDRTRTDSYYQDTTALLQEVMTKMA